MTAVIEASSAGVKDMADGSLRITFEFEPRHAAEAFALFGPRGRAVAIAALKDGAKSLSDKQNANPSSAEPEKPKGGEWAKLAGIWCEDPDFWDWASSQAFDGQRWSITTGGKAAELIRDVCRIDSRAKLDHDPEALDLFHRRIRIPFKAWMQARGINK